MRSILAGVKGVGDDPLMSHAAQPIEIHVKTLTGTNCNVQVCASDTVHVAKVKIGSAINAAPELIHGTAP
jgi:hypothetical protein